MTPTAAARVWVLTQRVIDGVSKANDAAARVLKDHCAKSGLTSYRGIGYSESTQRRLDTTLARAELGPEKTDACTKAVVRRALTLPASAKPIVPAELA